MGFKDFMDAFNHQKELGKTMDEKTLKICKALEVLLDEELITFDQCFEIAEKVDKMNGSYKLVTK